MSYKPSEIYYISTNNAINSKNYYKIDLICVKKAVNSFHVHVHAMGVLSEPWTVADTMRLFPCNPASNTYIRVHLKMYE